MQSQRMYTYNYVAKKANQLSRKDYFHQHLKIMPIFVVLKGKETEL